MGSFYVLTDLNLLTSSHEKIEKAFLKIWTGPKEAKYFLTLCYCGQN